MRYEDDWRVFVIFPNFVKDERLAKILNGKSIVLVGPSSHLVGRLAGKEIDKYDVVCRINEVMPKDYSLDFGTKTKVIFYNCARKCLSEFQYKMDRDAEYTKQIEMVVCNSIKSMGQENWQTWGDNFIAPIVDDWNSINKYDLPFLWIGMKNFKMFHNAIGTEPNSGFLAILMLLQYDIKELFITGYSFYVQSNQIDGCYHGDYIVNEVYTEENNPYRHFNAWLSHNQNAQVDYFKNVVLKEYGDIVRIDSYVDMMLKLNHKNVYRL